MMLEILIAPYNTKLLISSLLSKSTVALLLVAIGIEKE